MIGELRHRLTLQQPVRTADGGGGAGVVWADLADLWGSVEPLSGRETPAAERAQATVSHRIRLRYRTDVAPAMRFRLGARLFNIRSVIDEGERRRWLVCLCEEGGPQ